MDTDIEDENQIMRSILAMVVGLSLILGSSKAEGTSLTPQEISYLQRVEKATFRGFEQFFDEATGLPADIAALRDGHAVKQPKNANYSKTSPTNIGLGFLYLVLSRDRGYLSEQEATRRALAMMDTLEKLQTYQGFLYNWYQLTGEKGEIPQPMQDRFVSSLDNGDLDIALMAVCGAFPNTQLSQRIDNFLAKKNYHFFFNKNPHDPNKGMISLGYDGAKQVYSSADYSIFNIEGRMTVLLAILKDNVPDSAWKQMERLVRYYTLQNGQTVPVVAPWGGSLYETLFADEILGGFKVAPKAFGQNALNMIRIHQDKGKRISKSGIWGLSNGEVPAEDRYEMAGVPEIAYNRFPGTFMTVYSSFLSLRYVPKEVVENLRRVEALNADAFQPSYGFTDSIDPKTGVINRNILSLDKGMEVLSIGNFMNALEGKREIPDYFWRYLQRKRWSKKANSLFKDEENHPSFQALSQGQRPDISSGMAKMQALDILGVRKEIGAFYEPGRAKASYRLVDAGETSPIIEAQYDVSQRYSYCGIYLKVDDLDISSHKKFTFQIRGSQMKGFPETVKVEIKWRGKYVAFEHVPLTATWTIGQITIPPGAAKIDELSFVFENASCGKHPDGEVSIRSLTFQ